MPLQGWPGPGFGPRVLSGPGRRAGPGVLQAAGQCPRQPRSDEGAVSVSATSGAVTTSLMAPRVSGTLAAGKIGLIHLGQCLGQRDPNTDEVDARGCRFPKQLSNR